MYISRDIKNKFDKIDRNYNLIALVGARQAGKTTFLKEQMKSKKSSYVLFDDPDARALFDEDIKKFEMQYIENFELSVLDEAQYCKDAGSKLKYLVDMGRKLWITSSSEIILGKKILSYLVGRVSVLRLYPFSFPEFLRAKGQKSSISKILQRNIWEHMTYGGYPKVVLTKELEMKRIVLRNLYETMLLKDVAFMFSIDSISTLEKCAKYLAISTGGLVSYEKMSTVLTISFQTLKKYIDAMEKSYLIRRVEPFFTNKTKEITKQPKIYFLDNGLRNAIIDTFSPEPDGRLFENYVLSELIKLDMSPKYWRTKTKTEVDFIVERDGEIIPIEVKLMGKPNKIERSMRSFISTYGPKKCVVVTYAGEKGEMKVNGCKIIFTDILGLRDVL